VARNESTMSLLDEDLGDVGVVGDEVAGARGHPPLGDPDEQAQDGAALVPGTEHVLLEDGLHDRVDAGGGLVEDEELGPGGQGRHQRHLLAVALRVGPALLRGVELEALDQLVAAGLVEVTAQPAEQVDDLAAAEVGPEGDVAGHVGEAVVEPVGVVPRVAVE
jgi:hypothetical protein